MACSSTLDVAPADPAGALERHRPELTRHCYRMLGSAFEAEDAVQETIVRAWRSFGGFEGRAALRSWLYRIATNVCLDMLQSRKRRPLPMDLGPESPGDAVAAHWLPEHAWRHLRWDGGAARPADDPAELAASRETIRVAFLAALQHLPPRQRAVLILREVLRWKATEVAELLGTSVVSVNSALQRARARIAAKNVTAGKQLRLDDRAHQGRLARYIDAFERADMESLVSLLHDEATMSP
jgi:RNA polymerase sigma-70 factor, ECF subfamily